MTDQELTQIETLLLRLREVIGAPILVIPGYLQDGVSLAVYDKDGNAPVFTVTTVDLKTCVEKYFKSISK